MQVEVHSLASGSSGNCMLIKADGRGLLVDAGLSGRRIAMLLGQREIRTGSLEAMLLTHEHDDHLRGAAVVSDRLKAPVIANRGTLAAAAGRCDLKNVREMESGSERQVGPFHVRSFRIPHDAADPIGYVITVGGAKIVYATDIGRPCRTVRESLKGASLIVLEANHDLEWLRRGPYPARMKARIGSDRGHLANHAAADLLAARLEDGGPACIWLAHLSAVNNSPALARRDVERSIRARTRTAMTLVVALRDRPSVTWRPGAFSFQPSLF